MRRDGHDLHASRADGGRKTSIDFIWTGFARLLDGKSAALFCILAGMSRALQAERSGGSARFPVYVARRSVTFAVWGLLLHLRVWPTEILIPLALMMPLSLAIRQRGSRAVALTIVLLMIAVPLLTARFGACAALDWNEDGGHIADHSVGWGTLRYLLFDGNYPLIPWLAFPLVGMALSRQSERTSPLQSDCARARSLFWGACVVAVGAHALASWASVHEASLGFLAPHLLSTWVPTSLPFLLETGGYAVAVLAGLYRWQSVRRLSPSLLPLAALGRASLTHYLLHICLVIVPLRLAFTGEEWPIRTGLTAFMIYVSLAIPLSALWFRRFPRGPFEAIWARLSGSNRE